MNNSNNNKVDEIVEKFNKLVLELETIKKDMPRFHSALIDSLK